MAGSRKPIDWPGIEADYRKTTTSIRDLAKWYRLAEASIRDRAKRYGWERTAQGAPSKSAQSETEVEKRVQRAVAAIADVEAMAKPPATCAADLLDEAYATLRDVMANSPFPAPRVTAARAVVGFAREEAMAKGAGTGKKAQRQAGAEKAASQGRFAVPQPPRAGLN